ncbi:hypothetical protein NBRC116593_05770 [Sulfitobacter pacificus]
MPNLAACRPLLGINKRASHHILHRVYAARVTVLTGAKRIDCKGIAAGIIWRKKGRQRKASGHCCEAMLTGLNL